MGRRALVIGNSNYHRHRHPLRNPSRDAERISVKLEELGFRVNCGLNLDFKEFEDRIGDFVAATQNTDEALIYYAGHGIQLNGENYILPIDARFSTPKDVRAIGISLNDHLLKRLRAAVRLIFLDACRNNPFIDDMEKFAKSHGSRSMSLSRGLALTPGAAGTYIAFATEPDSTADDGDDGANSTFTTALLRNIGVVGQSAEELLINVRKEVIKVTNGKQTPWSHSALTEKFYFIPPPAIPTPERWQTTVSSQDPPQLHAFIKEFPQSSHALQARQLLKELSNKDWTRAQNEKSEDGFQFYIDRWPDGEHLDQARKAISGLRRDREERDWRAAKNHNTIESFEKFLRTWNEGQYRQQALDHIQRLSDETAFSKANCVNTKQAYIDYIKDFPDGRFVSSARQQLSWIELREDDTDWRKATGLDNPEGYKNYLSQQPNGHYRVEANQRIDELALAAKSPYGIQDVEKWNWAQFEDTCSAYEEYLRDCPNGIFRMDAEQRIVELSTVCPFEMQVQNAPVQRSEPKQEFAPLVSYDEPNTAFWRVAAMSLLAGLISFLVTYYALPIGNKPHGVPPIAALPDTKRPSPLQGDVLVPSPNSIKRLIEGRQQPSGGASAPILVEKPALAPRRKHKN